MRVYIAGRTSQADAVNRVQELFVQAGHSITHDWTGPEGGIKPDWSHNREEAREVAIKDRDGVAKADAVILCGWGCEEGGGGLGCFIEVGIAFALWIPVIILGPCRESVFWYLPNVIHIKNDADVVKAMEEMV